MTASGYCDTPVKVILCFHKEKSLLSGEGDRHQTTICSRDFPIYWNDDSCIELHYYDPSGAFGEAVAEIEWWVLDSN